MTVGWAEGLRNRGGGLALWPGGLSGNLGVHSARQAGASDWAEPRADKAFCNKDLQSVLQRMLPVVFSDFFPVFPQREKSSSNLKHSLTFLTRSGFG